MTGSARYGIRVPGVVVSPYAKRHHVSHTVYDHTSVLAFVERKWNLPAMTWRDANANDLVDMLDVAAMSGRRPTFPELPSLDAPGDTPGALACSTTGPGTIPPPIEHQSSRVSASPMRILYIDIDTLRPDHLGCYGYHRSTSPTIDGLAAGGVRFSNVYASDVPVPPEPYRPQHRDVRHPQRGGQPRRSGGRPAPVGVRALVHVSAGMALLCRRAPERRVPHCVVVELSAAPRCDLVDRRVHGVDEPHARSGRRARRRGPARVRSIGSSAADDRTSGSCTSTSGTRIRRTTHRTSTATLSKASPARHGTPRRSVPATGPWLVRTRRRSPGGSSPTSRGGHRRVIPAASPPWMTSA